MRGRTWMVAAVVVVGGVLFTGCSGEEADDAATSEDSTPAEDFSDQLESTTTTAFQPAPEAEALCALMAEQEELLIGATGALPTREQVAALQAMVPVAPPSIAEDLRRFADGLAAADAALRDPLAPESQAAVDALTATEFIDSAVAVSSFAAFDCGLDEAALPPDGAGVSPAAAGAEVEDGSDDGPLDPDAIRVALEGTDLPAIKEVVVWDSVAGGVEVQVLITALAGTDGALEVCEALSAHLYDDLDEDRVGINVETEDGGAYASRFNDTADCR